MSSSQTQARRSWLVLAIILLLALGLRLGRLTFQPLWADEGYSVYFAGLDPLALAEATARDIHPPLYYYLLKAWTALLGPGVASLRLLSVGCGVLTVALVYALARRLLSRRAAHLSALALAISPFHIYYSQEVRMYALAALLTTASTLCIAAHVRAEEDAEPGRNRLLLLLYVATTALSLYTLYYAALVLAAQVIFLLVYLRGRRRTLLTWLGAAAAAVVLYLPWLVGSASVLSSYVAGKVAVEQYAALDPLTFCAQVLGALGMGVPSQPVWFLALGAVPVLAAAVVALAAALPGRAGHGSRWPIGLLATVSLVPVLLGYAVNLLWPFSPVGFQRLFLICLPPLAVLAGAGLDHLLASAATYLSVLNGTRPKLGLLPWAGLGLAACAVLFACATLLDFYRTPRYPQDDYRPLVRDMSALAHPDDVLIALYPWQLGFVRAYFAGAPPQQVFIERAADWAAYPAVMHQDLERLAKGRRLWFPTLETRGGLLEAAVTKYLTATAFSATSSWYGNHRLYLYAWDGGGSPVAFGVRAGSGLVLDEAGITLDPVAAGRDSVCVELHWRAVGALPPEGQIALRLVDDAGQTWLRRDSAPQNGSLPFTAWPASASVTDRHAIPIPATTPAGSYRLLAGVYDKAAGANLPLTAASGQPLGAEVELGKVVVTRSDPYHPPVAALGISHPLTVRFTAAPTLVGFDLAGAAIRPGHPVHLDVYWQAVSPAAEDPVLFVQARDRANKVWGLYEGDAATPGYPPSRWTAGEIVRGQVGFLLAPDAPAGEYQLVLGWLKGRSTERVAVAGGGNEVVLARVPAVARPHVTTLPRPVRPLEARAGESVQFLGYDIDRESAEPGATVQLVLYWRVLGRMDASYSVFVHLVDERGDIGAQNDGVPGRGEMPTTSWLPGEVISDSRELVLPAGLAPGSYTLSAGMYRSGGSRLPISGSAAGRGGDTIELGSLTVTAP